MPNPLKHDYTTKVIPGKFRRIDVTGSEFIRACTKEYEPFRPGSHFSRTTSQGNDSWAGGSFEQAVRLYSEGWEQGLKNVSEIQSKITDRLQCRYSKREMCYEVYGGHPDVGVFLANDPENMIHRTVNEQESSSISEHKILTMVVNVTASCYQDNVKISSIRGAISMAIIDILEDIGYRVEVQAVICMSKSGKGRFPEQVNQFCITVKRPNDILDREKLAYCLCHSTMFRQLGLALLENYGFDSTNNHGIPSEAPEKGDLYIPHANVFKFGNNLEEWIKTTLDFLSKVGVQLKDK